MMVSFLLIQRALKDIWQAGTDGIAGRRKIMTMTNRMQYLHAPETMQEFKEGHLIFPKRRREAD